MTELNYLGAVDLTQYFVKSYSFSDADEYLNISTYGNKGAQVDFIFSRRLINQVLTVFLPTVCFWNYSCQPAGFVWMCAFSDYHCNCLLLHQLFQGTLFVFYSQVNIAVCKSYFLYFRQQTLKLKSQWMSQRYLCWPHSSLASLMPSQEHPMWRRWTSGWSPT